MDKSAEVKKLIGARILSEANDLKRTISSFAKEIDYDEGRLNRIIQGDCDFKEIREVIERMGRNYPIDASDFYLYEDDCPCGIKIMQAEESKQSSRIFDRKDRNGQRTPFYEYRDTAMSKSGPFKPEWIKELRVVDNNDPENPDVAYNNGHFLHQMTFVIGPVNFYWELRGKKFCAEMNTGDSNYITPFWPHTFASRDPEQLALIIAVTYGGDVRRAQKEFYMMGRSSIRDYQLDMSSHEKATSQLIQQHMANENLTIETLQNIIDQEGLRLKLTEVLEGQQKLSIEDLEALASCLNIELGDLFIPETVAEQDVIVKNKSDEESCYFPNEQSKLYKINSLARCSKMASMKGFDIEILAQEAQLDTPFVSSLHSYVYNYGDSGTNVKWMKDEESFEDTINPGDSLYLKPFVKHAYANTSGRNAKLLVVRVSGAVNITTQKELSYFADTDRVIESKCWFD